MKQQQNNTLIISKPDVLNDDDLIRFEKYNPVIYETTGKNDKNNINRILNKKKYDLVIAIGGDGTVNLLASLLINTNIKLAIIPRGSTNGTFYELATKEKPLEKRKLKIIDVIKINKNYCVHLAGFGLNAQIIKDSRKKNLKGFFKYIFSFFNSIKKIKKYEFEINNKMMSTRLLILANGKSYGKGLTINPEGEMDDGKFEVCTLQEQIKYDEVKIINKDKAPFHIDGEFLGHPKIIVASIKKKSLKLLI